MAGRDGESGAAVDAVQAAVTITGNATVSNTTTVTWTATAPAGSGPGATLTGLTPADSATITAPTALTLGAVTPNPAVTTITSWAVSMRPAGTDSGDPQDRIIATGTGAPPVGADPIATLDPTVLANGIWLVRVAVVDSTNSVCSLETSVIVDGQLKLGRYRVTYQDLNVPVAGIPIQVLRTYDTVDRLKKGDFGSGWSLDVANFRVQANRPVGDGGFEQYQCGGALFLTALAPVCYKVNRSHFVTVTWPDGHTETFDFTPKGLNGFVGFIALPAYTGRANTTSKLEAAPGDEQAAFLGDPTGKDGTINHGFFGEDGLYQPTRFLLTAKNGTKYLLDTATGLVEATDRNANRIAVTRDGITSSAGPSIRFARDDRDRIIAITGPDGHALGYTYDSNGDLHAVTDQNGHATGFTYRAGHYLANVDDLGPGVFRQLDYWPDGRLKTITDANGHATSVAEPVLGAAQSQQTVVAPDGLVTTITTFDARGNPTDQDSIYADPANGDHHHTAWTYTTDNRDLVTSRQDPATRRWQGTYDGTGNLKTFTDPGNRTTRFAEREQRSDDFGACEQQWLCDRVVWSTPSTTTIGHVRVRDRSERRWPLRRRRSSRQQCFPGPVGACRRAAMEGL